MLSISTTALTGGLLEVFHIFKGAPVLAESGISYALLVRTHFFVAGVGLLSVVQGSQFDFEITDLAYYRCQEVDCDDKVSVRWFTYEIASGNVFDISASETTTSKRTVSDVQVKKWVGAVFVVFMTGHLKKLAKAADAVRSVAGSSADFPNPAYDIPIVQDKVVKIVSQRNLADLTFKHDRGPSALRKIGELCRT